MSLPGLVPAQFQDPGPLPAQDSFGFPGGEAGPGGGGLQSAPPRPGSPDTLSPSPALNGRLSERNNRKVTVVFVAGGFPSQGVEEGIGVW